MTKTTNETVPGEMDPALAARVIESLVLRGDVSALDPSERARFYVATCEGLGLNPHAQPFAFLRLNGKEVLYATRGATDQLAAIHRVNREIVDGPKVIDLAGTNLVYCVCRASLPNGRTETSTATLPLADPANVMMKAETKAKRRATLSILGLSLLDEMELETIPAEVQSQGGGVDLTAARGTRTVRDPGAPPPPMPVSQQIAATAPSAKPTLLSVLTEIREATSSADLSALTVRHHAWVGALSKDSRETIDRAFVARLVTLDVEEAVASANATTDFNSLGETVVAAERSGKIDAAERERLIVHINEAADRIENEGTAEAATPAAVPSEAPVTSLEGFYQRVAEIELPGESVSVWMKYRAELAPLPVADREAAWKALCQKTEEVGKMKNAKVWLKKAIAEEDQRRQGSPADTQAA